MKLKKENGITLIALVITIIVLLILAGVSLSLVSGENGILKRATDAVDVNERASAEEQANLVLAEIVTQYYEEKYVNHNATVGTIDSYIITNLPKTTEGGFTVRYDENRSQVIVSKGDKEISRGEIEDGKVGWTGSDSTGGDTTQKPVQTTLASVTDANIGDYIDLGNNVVGTSATTDDWRIFYKEGNIVYVILADYLPNSTGYATAAGLKTSADKPYSVWSTVISDTSRDELMNSLKHATAWNSLASGITGATVTGTPTYEQLKTSWNRNSKMGSSKLSEMVNYHSELSDTTGLYIPHTGTVSGCTGYWLAMPHAEHKDTMWIVACWNNSVSTSTVGNGDADHNQYGVRPVVSLPLSTTATKDGNIWTIQK